MQTPVNFEYIHMERHFSLCVVLLDRHVADLYQICSGISKQNVGLGHMEFLNVLVKL